MPCAVAQIGTQKVFFCSMFWEMARRYPEKWFPPPCRVICHYKVRISTFWYIVKKILLPDIRQLAVRAGERPKRLPNQEYLYLSFGGILDRIVWLAVGSCRELILKIHQYRATLKSRTLRKISFPSLLMLSKDYPLSCYECMNLKHIFSVISTPYYRCSSSY